MSRQLEQIQEDRNHRRNNHIVSAVEFELEQGVERAGASYSGFAFKRRPGDCLLVVKGVLAGRKQVAFVGSDDLAGCLLKAVRLAKGDKLVWKVDKYES